MADFITLSINPDTSAFTSMLSELPSNEDKISSIFVSKVIYLSIIRPLLSSKSLIVSTFFLFEVSAKQTFIFPPPTSKGIALDAFAKSIEI